MIYSHQMLSSELALARGMFFGNVLQQAPWLLLGRQLLNIFPIRFGQRTTVPLSPHNSILMASLQPDQWLVDNEGIY